MTVTKLRSLVKTISWRIVGTMDIGTQNIERALTSAFKCGYEIMEIKENRIIVVTKVL